MRDKITILWAGLVLIGTLLVIMISLDEIDYKPKGQLRPERNMDSGKGRLIDTLTDNIVKKTFLSFIVLVVALPVIFPKLRSRFTQIFLILVFLVCYSIYLMSSRSPPLEKREIRIKVESYQEVLNSQKIGGIDPSGLIVWLIRITLAGLTVYCGYLIWKRAKQDPKINQLQEAKVEAIKQKLTDSTINSLNGIHSGLNIKNVIFHYYVEISDILNRNYSINTNEAFTLREYESSLMKIDGYSQNKSLQSHFFEISRIFEKIRYSKQPMNQTDEQVAKQCLIGIREILK